MWPWEHVAVAYLGYSVYRRIRLGEPPDDRGTIVVAVASLFPDLVDKPLSWAAGVFPSGYAVGHSAVGWILVAGLLLVSRRRLPDGVVAAAAIGHGSHLVGDVLYPVLLGEGVAVRRVLWPLVTLPPYDKRLGLLDRTLHYLRVHAAEALSGDLGLAVAFELGILAVVGGLWLADGAPGLGVLRPADRR